MSTWYSNQSLYCALAPFVATCTVLVYVYLNVFTCTQAMAPALSVISCPDVSKHFIMRCGINVLTPDLCDDCIADFTPWNGIPEDPVRVVWVRILD